MTSSGDTHIEKLPTTAYYFAIQNSESKKAVPCAFMSYSHEKGFEIFISPQATKDEVPAFFIPFVEKRELYLDPRIALTWIQERIVPPSRQNIAEILAAHGLLEYSEIALVLSGHLMSSQDSFIARQITKAEFMTKRTDGYQGLRENLGALIQARRQAKGLYQHELAHKLGVSQPVLSTVERGKANPTFDLLVALDSELTLGNTHFLEIAAPVLWTHERSALFSRLNRFYPELAELYSETIRQLEKAATHDEEDAQSLIVVDALMCRFIQETLQIAQHFEHEQIENLHIRLNADKLQEYRFYEEVLEEVEQLLRHCIQEIEVSEKPLFCLIEKANRVDKMGNFERPSQEDTARFCKLLKQTRVKDYVKRAVKNPYWKSGFC